MSPVLRDWLQEVRQTLVVVGMFVLTVFALVAGAWALYHVAWTAPIEASLTDSLPDVGDGATLRYWTCDCLPGPGGHEAGLAVFDAPNLSTSLLLAAGWQASPADLGAAVEWARRGRGDPALPKSVANDWNGQYRIEIGKHLFLVDMDGQTVIMAFYR
ncbi:MAG: hypothetical protein AAGF22_08870 [Pseudomonadota bacterium]